MPTDDNKPTELQTDIAHMLVDFGLFEFSGQRKAIAKLAPVLQEKLKKNISPNTLFHALSGYRSTAPYIGYLTVLRQHLEECRLTGKNPVTVYTDEDESQDDRNVTDGLMSGTASGLHRNAHPDTQVF